MKSSTAVGHHGFAVACSVGSDQFRSALKGCQWRCHVAQISCVQCSPSSTSDRLEMEVVGASNSQLARSQQAKDLVGAQAAKGASASKYDFVKVWFLSVRQPWTQLRVTANLNCLKRVVCGTDTGSTAALRPGFLVQDLQQGCWVGAPCGTLGCACSCSIRPSGFLCSSRVSCHCAATK